MKEIDIISRTIQATARNGRGATSGATAPVSALAAAIDFPGLFAKEMAKWFARDLETKAIYPVDYQKEAVGIYSKSFLSALGPNPDSSGSVAGVTELSKLSDVALSALQAGQALVWNGSKWTNRLIDTGLDEDALLDYLTENGYATQNWVTGKGYATTSAMNTALSGKVDKVSGKGLSSNDFTDALLTKLNGIEEGANKYTLPTASSSVLGGVKVGTTLAISSGVLNLKGVGTAGTYTKVTTNAYGQVTSGAALSSSDIPGLPWSKITSGKPTTLEGYGITDAYTREVADERFVNVSGDTMSGLLTANGGVDASFVQVGDGRIRWDAETNALYVEKSDGTAAGFYATGYVSSKGSNPSAGGTVAGVTSLSELTDVSLNALASGQVLAWNGSKWVNRTLEPGLDEGALKDYLDANQYVTQSWVSGQAFLKSVSLSTISGLHSSWGPA